MAWAASLRPLSASSSSTCCSSPAGWPENKEHGREEPPAPGAVIVHRPYADHGPALPDGGGRSGILAVPAPGCRQPSFSRWGCCWVEPDRPELHRRRPFLGTNVSDLAA